jgi:predicted transcriptional regulator
MSRLTITLSDARYRALKEAAAQRDKTIGQLIEESLEFYGIKTHEDARELVRRARARAGLGEAEAVALAQTEVRAHRKRGRKGTARP